MQLRIAQRPAGPVGKARTFVNPLAGEPAHQGIVADGVAEAADHCRDLRIEDRMRQPAEAVKEDLQVLASRVKHLEQRFVVQKIGHRSQIEPGRQRVHGDGTVGPADLQQAQLRPVGLIAQEFGIDGNEVGAPKISTERTENARLGDDQHGGSYSLSRGTWEGPDARVRTITRPSAARARLGLDKAGRAGACHRHFLQRASLRHFGTFFHASIPYAHLRRVARLP